MSGSWTFPCILSFWFSKTKKCPRIGPEVTEGCLGVFSTHYSLTAFPDHFGPKLHKKRYNRSEGFALTGYDIPGCVEDGAWMLWENSSVAAVAVVVAHLVLGRGQLSVLLRLRRFRDARIDPSRQASTDGPSTMKSCRRKAQNIQKTCKKILKTTQHHLT